MATKLRWIANHFPKQNEEPEIREFLRGKQVGEPLMTGLPGSISVEQLKRWGAVGIYVREEENGNEN